MLTDMRSTVIIDDDLFRRAKQRAAALNTTLSDVVNQALRQSLAEPILKAPAFHMITFGDPGARVRHEPGDLHAAIDDDDRRSLRR
jgi:hypothetical protein